MSSHKPRCIILIIRIRADFTVVLVWIICSPRQNIGGGFLLKNQRINAYPLIARTSYNILVNNIVC